MSKISSTTYHHKFLLKIGLTVITGLMGQAALAVCPDAISISIESKSVGTTSKGKKIYYCEQYFTNDELSFTVNEKQLLPDGSRAISRGDTDTRQEFSLLTSVDLAGFTIDKLRFSDSIFANYPNKNGSYNSPSLFNFYTKTTDKDECDGTSRGFPDNQYQLIINQLKADPSIFQANSISGSSSSDSIAKIIGVKLNSDIGETKELEADISLYHANAIKNPGQYFTRKGWGTQERYCWVGVGTTMEIKPNNGSLKYAGGYNLQIKVLAQ